LWAGWVAACGGSIVALRSDWNEGTKRAEMVVAYDKIAQQNAAMLRLVPALRRRGEVVSVLSVGKKESPVELA
jgi:hypothetical protein